MRVLSINVMFNDIYIRERHSALVDAILNDEMECDIICLQEVMRPCSAWFEQALAVRYKCAVRVPNTRVYGEMVFHSPNVSVSSVECIPLQSQMGRALQVVNIATGGRVITFHLESYAGKASYGIRAAQLRVLFDTMRASPGWCIACGDTNIPDKVLALPRGIEDAWESVGSPAEYAFTFNADRFWERPGKKRYDRMFTSGIKCVGWGSLGHDPIINDPPVWLSDHDGIIFIGVPQK